MKEVRPGPSSLWFKGTERSGSSRVVKGKSSGRRSSSMDKKEHEYRSYKN